MFTVHLHATSHNKLLLKGVNEAARLTESATAWLELSSEIFDFN